MKLKRLADLFLTFAKIGLFTFGGGYAMIPLIENNCVERKKWLTHEEMMDITVVAESTPGPIAINAATFTGNTKGGIFGALLATAAVVLPSFLIILIIARILKTWIKNRYVQAALRGLKPCIIGLILATGVYMVLNYALNLSGGITLDRRALLLTGVLAACLFLFQPVFKKKMSPILLILIAAVLGIGVYGF